MLEELSLLLEELWLEILEDETELVLDRLLELAEFVGGEFLLPPPPPPPQAVVVRVLIISAAVNKMRFINHLQFSL